jgi:hypothetical protein
MNSQSRWSGLLSTHSHFLMVRITTQYSFMNKFLTLQFIVYKLHNNLINLFTYDYKHSWVGLFFLWDCQVERLGIPHPKVLSFSLLLKVCIAKDSRWLRKMLSTIGPSMSTSKLNPPFKVVKEMHPFTFQALIKACSPLSYLIMNINSSIGDRLTTPMITFMFLKNLPSNSH